MGAQKIINMMLRYIGGRRSNTILRLEIATSMLVTVERHFRKVQEPGDDRNHREFRIGPPETI